MIQDSSQVKSFIYVNFLCLLIIFALIFGPLVNMSNSVNAIITMLAGFVFMLIHGYLALGMRNIIAYVLITWILSFSAEAIGVATGAIFGPYYYSDHLGPKILGVPLMIQISYAAMGYASIMTARLILAVRSPRNLLPLVLATLIGTFLMVGWDVCLDPYESTVGGDWIWTIGGPYFGIGIQNFVGWFATVFIFMFVYHLFARYYPEKNDIRMDRTLWSQPLIYYALMGLNIVLVPWIGGVSTTYATPSNYTGTPQDLINSLALITFFIMGAPSLIALARILMNETQK